MVQEKWSDYLPWNQWKKYHDPARKSLYWFEKPLTSKKVGPRILQRAIDKGNIAQDAALGGLNPGRYGPFKGGVARSKAIVAADDAAAKAAHDAITPKGHLDALKAAWQGLSPAGKVAAGLGAAGAGYLGYKGLTSKTKD